MRMGIGFQLGASFAVPVAALALITGVGVGNFTAAKNDLIAKEALLAKIHDIALQTTRGRYASRGYALTRKAREADRIPHHFADADADLAYVNAHAALLPGLAERARGVEDAVAQINQHTSTLLRAKRRTCLYEECEVVVVTSSRAATLADEIEAAVLAGEIASGVRLGTKDDLRRRYDVAYGTLNEALRILQQRGYVTSRTGPGGGLFATIPTSSDRLRHLLSAFPESGTLRECAEVRHSLEGAVTADATRSRTRADVADLRRIYKRMAVVADDDGSAYLHENWRLHRRIAECCKNRVLANLYVTLLDANEPGPGVAIPDRHRAANAEENLVAHAELIDAIASGSQERARRAVEAHEAFFAPVNDKPLGPKRATPARPLAGKRNAVSRPAAQPQRGGAA